MVESLSTRITELIEITIKLTDLVYPNYNFKIGHLTLFSHNTDDYNSLRSLLSSYGDEKEANNGYKYILNTTLELSDEKIEVIRVRKPDVHRHELGCCDLIYNEKDYEKLRNEALEKGLDIILRKGYEMIELSTFNLNVYAYLVKDIR